MRSILVAFSIISMARRLCHAAHPEQRAIKIKNESGKHTEVYWLSPSGEKVLIQSGIVNGQAFDLNSYVNHTFLVQELPDEDTGSCDAGTPIAAPSLQPCRKAFVKVNEHDDQGELWTYVSYGSIRRI